MTVQAALEILTPYGTPEEPSHREHDSLSIWGVDPKLVSETDKERLAALGFVPLEGLPCFASFGEAE